MLDRSRSKRGRNKEVLVEAAKGVTEAESQDVLIASYLLKRVSAVL
jgi:hypothetical protein